MVMKCRYARTPSVAVASGLMGIRTTIVVPTADAYLSDAVELRLKAAAAATRLVLKAGKSPVPGRNFGPVGADPHQYLNGYSISSDTLDE
jgi:hypothetical protein